MYVCFVLKELVYLRINIANLAKLPVKCDTCSCKHYISKKVNW